MGIYRIDPIADPRWAAFVEWHPQASIFHTPGWLGALQRTYDYQPVAYTTSPPGQELRNGIPFCRISTWLTGRRLVSLPFSDHCAPLAENSEDLERLLASLQRELKTEKWQYVEIRPGYSDLPIRSDFTMTEAFYLHSLDLRPSLDELFRSFHKDCVQRKIKRAGREGLSYDAGNSDSLLEEFYGLLIQTRKRQGLPPQPLEWFRNLIACFGDRVQIRIASKNRSAVAGIITLIHKKALVYKYGCSDRRFNNLGGTQLLFWNAIQEARKDQLLVLDLGRSDAENSGLIKFKDRWGAERSPLLYFRCALRPSSRVGRTWQLNLARHVFSHVPSPFLAAVGRLLYRHIG
jgi:lipid II:glycine glycyltransferase (peptidoglycan interpeptide bridge formation enzyme)